MFLEPVSEAELFNIINELKKSNSAGLDNISCNVLKCAVNFIVKPLAFLINKSISEGVFPNILKIARIVPIHKKGEKTHVENYRPISLLSSLSKILERVMLNRMLSFITKNKILNKAQHGFRKNLSTKTAILEFINVLYNRLDNNEKCIGIFMDLSKAFDMVAHDLLLHKLHNYGFRGRVYNWLKSYLLGRSQLVDINGCKSDILKINYGVPQGSVLGPVLFILFVNDLPNIVQENNLIMFADDNSYLCSNANMSDVLLLTQHMLNTFVFWFNNNKLYLNREKTVFMHFTPNSSLLNKSELIKVESKSIAQVTSVKFLGLHLDNSLNWEVHINSLCSKLSPICYALYRLRDLASREVVLAYYHAQFVSRMTYGILFWGASTKNVRIFRIQKKAVRNIVGIPRNTSCREIFLSLRILTLTSLYILEILLYVKNNFQHFHQNNFFHKYHTRANTDLSIPLHSLSLYEKSPIYMGIKLYNKLPQTLKDIENIKIFKNKLTTYLMGKAFYTIEEYMND